MFVSRRALIRATTQLSRVKVSNTLFHRSISSEAKEVFTQLGNEEDPNRDAIFKYTWGTWLKNDEAQKKKRYTKFSLTGLQTVLKELYEQSRLNTENKNVKVVPLKEHKANFVSLPHNVSVKYFGSKNPNEEFQIKQLLSLHEGKHHRIYKVETNTLTSFILRIPYPLDTEYAISKRVQSEAATLDFVNLKLGINVPKVFAYGADKSNPINAPFILQEFIEGETLMKKWAPMTPHTDPKHKDIIGQVIDPLSEFQSKLAEVEFAKFGSLYFNIDSSLPVTEEYPYEGETDSSLKNRWFIGPSTERVFWRNKPLLKKSQIEPIVGPWDADKPLKLVEAVADIELENARTKLSLFQSDAGVVEKKEALDKEIETFTKLKAIAPILINVHSPSVQNIDELFKPRLAHTDLDPLNVLVDKNGEHVFLDFEGATIKPVIFQSTPKFVAYEDGPKVYEFEINEEEYSKMDETDKYYYDFAVARTRNEVQWDLNLGKLFTKLGSEGSPVLKRLRSPYLAAVERRSSSETAVVDRKIYEVILQWGQFSEHGFVGVKDCPIKADAEEFEQHNKELEAYYEELGSVPFAITGGWVPQDLFENLVSQGVITKLDNGDYKINNEPTQ